MTHSPVARVPLFCSYHTLTSSVIYLWTDTRQNGIYLLSRNWDTRVWPISAYIKEVLLHPFSIIAVALAGCLICLNIQIEHSSRQSPTQSLFGSSRRSVAWLVGGAWRDDPNNGCVGDLPSEACKIHYHRGRGRTHFQQPVFYSLHPSSFSVFLQGSEPLLRQITWTAWFYACAVKTKIQQNNTEAFPQLPF